MGQTMNGSNKYYAVAEGRKIGIFHNWNETKSMVEGYSGAKYKSFKTLIEAQEYLKTTVPDKVPNPLHIEMNVIDNCYDNREKTRGKNGANNGGENGGKIITYTDGSCINSIGGYGYVIIANETIKPVCGPVPHYPCTNQVAELIAIYMAINNMTNHYGNYLIKYGATIYTDSKYCIGCLTEWHYNWVNNGWINSKGKPVKNAELIEKILNLSIGLDIKYKHVKAHNGDTYNEWADQLANFGRELA